MVRSAKKQVFAVMSFSRAKGGIAIDAARTVESHDAALRLAQKLGSERVGAVAFYREVDPDIGEFDDPVVIGEFGTVPYDVRDIVT